MIRESCETILAPRLCDIWNRHTRGDPKLQFSLAGCQVLKDQTKKPGKSTFLEVGAHTVGSKREDTAPSASFSGGPPAQEQL